MTETPGSSRNSLLFAEEMMDFLKTIGGKIATGLVTLAVIAAGISWYEMDPATRHMLVLGTGRIFAWFGIMLVLPWATFHLIGRVGRMGSNLAGGILVFAYTALEALLLAWLFEWRVHGGTAIGFFCAATLIAAVYNLFTCDWIAEKVE
jgi:FtsH-binding integral membrane protein